MDDTHTSLVESQESQLVLDDMLRFDDNANRFAMELNTALGLSFEYSKKFASDPTVKKSSALTWRDSSGNVLRSETIVHSHVGPPGSLEQDVLTVLMSLCFDLLNTPQNEKLIKRANQVRVYFTLADVCRRLNLSRGSSGNIRKSIEKLHHQQVHFKDFICDFETFHSEDINTKIITSWGNSKGGKHGDSLEGTEGTYWVQFDLRIIASLNDGLFSSMSRETYNNLPRGPARRAYQIIAAKRKIEGNDFIIDVEELGSLLGLRDKRKMVYRLKKYLDALANELRGLSYVIKNVSGSKIIYINFTGPLLGYTQGESFYKDLVFWFGEEEIVKLNVDEYEIQSLLKELGDKELYSFKGESIPKNKFVIDLAAFQVISCSYTLNKSFQALARYLFKQEELTIPDKYKVYLDNRIKGRKERLLKDKIKQEKEKKEMEKAQHEKELQDAASEILNTIERNKPNEYKAILKIAEKELNKEGIESSSPVFKLMLRSKAEKITYNRLKKGVIGEKLQ